MKNKNKKEFRSSLYIYISVSFLIILVVVLISTIIYFAFIADIGSTKNSVKDLINNKLGDEIASKKILEELKTAATYGIFVGLALILVVTNRIIKPIRKITDATKKVATGDFTVKVNTRRRDEIGRLAYNFNIMLDELNSIEYLRKDFVSNVSHELKTPIASIQGFTKLLADKNTSEKEKEEYINIILEETNRLSNLSSNMIKLSNFENQEIVTNKTTYNLDEQLRKAIIMLEEKINKKNIKITLKLEPITITQDKDLTMEIWINLLNNAIKFTNENGQIDIKIEQKGEEIIVKIKDNRYWDNKRKSRKNI